MIIKQKNIIGALTVFLLGLILAFMLFPFSVISVKAESVKEFDKSNVLVDLKSSKIDGKPFDIREYPINEGLSPKILTFIEYCYSPVKNKQSNYGLYVYVYNPSGKLINTLSNQNKIEMAVTYDKDGIATDYSKFNLVFCNRSADSNYLNLFYKFRIADPQNLNLNRVNSIERRYDISGIELLMNGQTATESKIGMTYLFSGYSKGYGVDSSADSTLTSKVNEFETITLDVKSTNYRTGVSAAGKNHQNELNSVYFSVPERFFTEYGKLQKIKAEWWEYKTEPIVITARQSVYNSFLPFVGKDIGRYNKDVPFRMYSDYLASISTCTYKDGFNIANMSGSDTNYVNNVIPKIPLWFYESSDDLSGFTLGKERLSDYIYNYTSNYTSDTIDCNGRNLSADLFSNSVDSGRTRGYNVKEIDTDDKYDMLSYDSSHSGWDKFWEYFGNWGVETGGDYYGVSPIHTVTISDLASNNISETLLINIADVNEFKTHIETAKINNERTILFRFAQTDYFSTMYYIEKNGDIVVGKQHGILAEQTVFLDFDILTLTFNKEGKLFVIPAVSSPIDIINAVTPPLDIVDGCNMDLKTLLGLVIGVILFIVFFPWIIKLLIWLLRLPIRFIAWLFKPKGAKK